MRKMSLLAALWPLVTLAQTYNPVFVYNANADFPFMHPAGEGLFVFANRFQFGFVNKDLRIVTPAEFEWRKGQEWNVLKTPALRNGYAVVRQNGQPAVVDRSGRRVTDFLMVDDITHANLRANAFVVQRNMGYTSVGDQKFGLMDGKGKYIIPLEYDDMTMDSTIVVARKEDALSSLLPSTYLVFDVTGRRITPDEYAYVEVMPRDGLMLVEMPETRERRILNLKGEKIVSSRDVGEFITHVSQGRIIYQDMDTHDYGLLDLKGKVLTEPIYDEMNPAFDELGMIRIGKKRANELLKYDYGYLDRNGKEVIPMSPETAEYVGALPFGIAQDPKTMRKGIKDRRGNWLIKPEYNDARFPDRFGGVWLRSDKDYSWHYVQVATGKDFGTVTPKGAIPYEFDEQGYALASIQDSALRVAFDNGKMSAPIPDAGQAGLFSEGLAPLRSKSTGKFGFIDSTGRMVIPFQFDGADGFKQGVARVFLNTNGAMKGGYIDRKGKVLLPIEYDGVGNVSDGYGMVKKGTTTSYFDLKGKLVPPHKPFYQFSEFSGGLAMGVTLATVQGQPHTFTYFDNTFKDVLTLQAFDARPFFGNAAIVNRDGRAYVVVNRKGETVKPLPQIQDMKFYGQGLIAVKMNRMWGYMDEKVNITIPCQYDSVSQFMGGYATALFRGKWGVIDKTGKWIFQEKYPAILLGDEGQVTYRDPNASRWGMRWFFGGDAIPPQMHFATPFREGKAIVQYGRKYTILKSPLAK